MADVHDELCTSYAALALYDGEAELTSEQLKALIEATGNEVEAYWPILFASYLQKASVEDLVLAVGASPGGAVSGGEAAAAAGAVEGAAAGEGKKEEEEEDVDMGGAMDMFGGGDDDDY